jgi:predicted nucleic acid-binding protein
MILVDTSAWIGHLRGIDSVVVAELGSLIETGADLVTTEPIVMELLAGADTPERLEALDTLAHGLPLLSVDVRIDFRQAAGIYQAARRRGHTVHSLVDCLIASVAMRHDLPVLHEDRDYAAIAACLPLREHRPRQA